MSDKMSAQGAARHRIQNDLSERIFAAYYALPRAGIKKRSPKIAAALEAAKAGGRENWSWADVHDRLKVFERTERSLLRKHLVPKVAKQLARMKGQCADKWISSFKFAQAWNKPATRW